MFVKHGKGQGLLIGYYGEQNSGDDAFLAVTSWGTRMYSGITHSFATASHIPSFCADCISPLYFPIQFRGSGLYNRLHTAYRRHHSRSIVFGGGSNFHTTAHLQYWRKNIELAGPGPHYAVGISVGPFRDATAADECAQLFTHLAFIGVRDKASYERVKQLAPEAPVELTFDIAPLLPRAMNTVIPSVPASQRRGLGVSLCNYERFVSGDTQREEERIGIVAQAILKQVEAGLVDEVVLLDFNGHPHFGDHAVHQALRRQLEPSVPVQHIAYTGNPLAMMEALSRLRGVIAMRLHAAVFAFCTDTPVVMLSYHEKCQEWAKMIGLPEELIADTSSLTAETFAAKTTAMLRATSLKPGLSVADAVAASMRNWTWIAA